MGAEGSRFSNQTLLLAGIGLVLVGLLAGILGMLVASPRSGGMDERPRIVERVELGAPALPRLEGDSAVAAQNAFGSLNGLFRQVASRVTPAVVFIQVEMAQPDGGMPREWYEQFEGDSRRFFRRRAPRQSVGSGVIVSPQGYIVTNDHVVAGAREINVTLSDKRQYRAEIVGRDPSTDLAVLRIEGNENLPVIVLGNSDEVQVGDWVLAVGNPFRLTSTVTAGIVSALGRQVNVIDDRTPIEDFIQTDAAINPGNSGGALVNMNGELVGIATAIATESGTYEGYGFAVPVNLMERVIRDLISEGRVRRGFLGIEVQDLTARAARQMGLDHVQGVIVERVVSGGSAHLGGLRNGDIVLTIDGVAVNAPNELQSVIARRHVGDRLTLEVLRQGNRRSFEVELRGREDPSYAAWFEQLEGDGEAPRMPDLQPEHPGPHVRSLEQVGIGIRDLSERDRRAFEVEEGVYIAYVERGSLAQRAGLPRDVVLLKIDDRQVTSSEEALFAFDEAITLDNYVLFTVQRRDGVRAFFELSLSH
jgi:serine protease Do